MTFRCCWRLHAVQRVNKRIVGDRASLSSDNAPRYACVRCKSLPSQHHFIVILSASQWRVIMRMTDWRAVNCWGVLRGKWLHLERSLSLAAGPRMSSVCQRRADFADISPLSVRRSATYRVTKEHCVGLLHAQAAFCCGTCNPSVYHSSDCCVLVPSCEHLWAPLSVDFEFGRTAERLIILTRQDMQ